MDGLGSTVAGHDDAVPQACISGGDAVRVTIGERQARRCHVGLGAAGGALLAGVVAPLGERGAHASHVAAGLGRDRLCSACQAELRVVGVAGEVLATVHSLIDWQL